MKYDFPFRVLAFAGARHLLHTERANDPAFRRFVVDWRKQLVNEYIAETKERPKISPGAFHLNTN